MQQKIVIKVEMTCDKCRSKAMSLVAKTSGVDSVSIAGDAKGQVVVVGDSVDSVRLTSALRKKVGPAQLIEVADATKKKEEKKKEGKEEKKKEEKKKEEEVNKPVPYPWPYPYPYPYHCPPYIVCEQGPEYACTIL